MIGEIIAIGDELTSGRIMNTTSGFAARKLFDAGHTIHAMSTIGDTPSLIGEALIRAIGRADFIIVTGGLGSTDDDITNEAVSRALNRPTMPDLTILAWIREHLSTNKVSPNSPLEKLAWLPGGAEPFDPASRMAGYLLVHDDTPIFFLPGVPEEMMDLMSRVVLPKLAAWQEGATLQTMQRIYKVFAVSESEINRKINELRLPDSIGIGYYPVFPDVHVSVLLRNSDGQNRHGEFEAACSSLEAALGSSIYGSDNDEMEGVVGELLRRGGLQLSVAESCTGGLLSHRITRVPGSSAYFAGGAVTYSNELKHELLGVDNDLLIRVGAVSAETAAAMADGVRARCRTDIGLSITGIAGPDGGSAEKPVGTVYSAISHEHGSSVKKLNLQGSRGRIQSMAVQAGFDMLRLFLLELRKGCD
ncbi:MAG: CinA family nicotinamide mononucleotide deamidase-related protein [Desulfofustis sp.]|jgi:nicotinamide-nucleotide amidase|nr:CinA family nicotinamide mononucleotide deamidase-related protein [Desulfofustis sp.]